MKYLLVAALLALAGCASPPSSSELNVSGVTIRYLGHASFMIQGTSTVYIDPYVIPENATTADYILVTHRHFDHCARENIQKLQRKDTRIIAPLSCIANLTGKTNSIVPGEYFVYEFSNNLRIDAVEAYNVGKDFHPKGEGVGFVLAIDGVTIYHAGDTDFIPEMQALASQSIDVALVPIGGRYTMDAVEAATAVKVIKPKKVVPMHYNSDAYNVTGINADARAFASQLRGVADVVVLVPTGY